MEQRLRRLDLPRPPFQFQCRLPVLRGLQTDSVDLTCLDPPLNSNGRKVIPLIGEAESQEITGSKGIKYMIPISWVDFLMMLLPVLGRQP